VCFHLIYIYLLTLTVGNFLSTMLRSGISTSFLLSEDVCLRLLCQFGQILKGTEIPGSFVQTVQALMSSNNLLSYTAGVRTAQVQEPVLGFLKLTIFLISNNLFGEEAKIRREVYNWIKCYLNAGVLEHLLSIGGPTIEAFAEYLFQLALETGDAHMFKRLMKWGGINIDEQGYRVGGTRYFTVLQSACQSRSLDLVRLLIDEGADVNMAASCTDSPLTLALRRSVDPELVRILLRAGADVKSCDKNSLLSSAAGSGSLEVVQLLVSAGANVNSACGPGSCSPLCTAVNCDLAIPDEDVISIVRVLLQAGADANFTGMSFQHGRLTVLEIAICKRSIELVQILLDNGAQITEDAFVKAVKHRSLDMAKLLLKYQGRVTEAIVKRVVKDGELEVVLFLIDVAEDDIKDRCRSIALVFAICYGRMDLIPALDGKILPFKLDDKLIAAIEAAASRGDTHAIHLLLSENSINQAIIRRGLGDSLSRAILNSQDETTELLLMAGADVNFGEPYPLSAAISRGNSRLVRRLLTAGAAVNGESRGSERYSYTTTVLPEAAAQGDHTMIQDIINAGAALNAPCWDLSDESNALSVAVRKRDLSTVKFLIDAGADINAPAAVLIRPTALEAAARNNDIDMVRYLVSVGADPDEDSLTAAMSGSVELVQTLLTARLNRYQRFSRGFGCGALQYAIRIKNRRMIEILLANCVDPNAIPVPHIHDEVFHHSESMRKPRTSAFGAAIEIDQSEDLWIVRMLLNSGADPKVIVFDGSVAFRETQTALLAAIYQNNIRLVKLLIRSGANANDHFRFNVDRTPLQLAVEEGRMEIIDLLLEHNADVNAPPHKKYGATALQFAAIRGYVGIAKLLLEKGADVNALPAKIAGRTALEGAAEHGRIDMLQLLLNAGAQITGPGSEQYERAKKFASENGHNAARRLLESYHDNALGLTLFDWDSFAMEGPSY
jgi:ankyrin repeat protein